MKSNIVKISKIILMLFLLTSCIKENEYEYHEMIFQYVLLEEEVVIMYDTVLNQTVFIPYGNDTFGIDILFLAQLHGNPKMTMIYDVNTKKYYKT